MKENKGLSLVEVLIGASIAVAVITTLYTFLGQSFRSWNKIRKELAVYQDTNRALEILTQDIKRIPVPFIPTTPVGGSGEPIEIKADSAIRPINYVFKCIKNTLAVDDYGENYTYISFIFRINYFDKNVSPPRFRKALVRYYWNNKNIQDPSTNPIYKKLIRQIAFLPDAITSTSVLHEYDPTIDPDNANKWENQVLLDNAEEFQILFYSGEDQIPQEQWDFYQTGAIGGKLPAAIRVKIRAFHIEHDYSIFEQYPEKENSKNHTECTFITSVGIPVWRYE